MPRNRCKLARPPNFRRAVAHIQVYTSHARCNFKVQLQIQRAKHSSFQRVISAARQHQCSIALMTTLRTLILTITRASWSHAAKIRRQNSRSSASAAVGTAAWAPISHTCRSRRCALTSFMLPSSVVAVSAKLQCLPLVCIAHRDTSLQGSNPVHVLSCVQIFSVMLRNFEFEPIDPIPEPDYSCLVVGPKPCRVRYTRRATPL